MKVPTVLKEGTKRTWKMPCLPMQGYHGAERRDEQASHEPPPAPARATSDARAFQRGNTATFDDRDGCNITGVIVRINHRTATLAVIVRRRPPLPDAQAAGSI